jgi:hypothetical protein
MTKRASSKSTFRNKSTKTDSARTQVSRSSTTGRFVSQKSNGELAAKKALTIKAFQSAYRDHRKAS